MQEILSCQLFPPFKIPLAKSRITVCHFQPNRSAGPCSAPITRRQIPRLQAPVFLRLAHFPVLFPSLHSRVPLSQLMFALGGPNIQQSALNFSLFVENCRFQMQSLALKENLQVNTTALISILFTNSYIFHSFSTRALVKGFQGMSGFFRAGISLGILGWVLPSPHLLQCLFNMGAPTHSPPLTGAAGSITASSLVLKMQRAENRWNNLDHKEGQSVRSDFALRESWLYYMADWGWPPGQHPASATPISTEIPIKSKKAFCALTTIFRLYLRQFQLSFRKTFDEAAPCNLLTVGLLLSFGDRAVGRRLDEAIKKSTTLLCGEEKRTTTKKAQIGKSSVFSIKPPAMLPPMIICHMDGVIAS